MNVTFTDGTVTILHGDCRVQLADLEDDSLDSCVTDPPYEIGFMGKGHDRTGVAFDPVTWAQVFRVLKPGAHLVVFGAPRTWHRVAVAIEDVGFEIRDCILAWANGEGFPKSQNVSKAIDKAAGATRQVVGSKMGRPGYTLSPNDESDIAAFGDGFSTQSAEQRLRASEITAPATDDAARWEGWGTALKPAVEPIILARKPLDGTVIANVLTHGTGAMNIDASRVGYRDTADQRLDTRGVHSSGAYEGLSGGTAFRKDHNPVAAPHDLGRWPSNLVLVHDERCRPTGGTKSVRTNMGYPAARGAGGIGQDGHKGQDDLVQHRPSHEDIEEWVCVPGCPVAALDEQSGEAGSFLKAGKVYRNQQNNRIYGALDEADMWGYGDTGGASRFYARFAHEVDEQVMADGPIRYMAKAPQRERPEYTDDAGETVQHSTVKPLTLIRYLVKLVTPPGGRCLDPFVGSGTTPEACVLEGFAFLGCERTEEYLPLIEQRIARGYRGGPAYPDPVAAPPKPDANQTSLFDL